MSSLLAKTAVLVFLTLGTLSFTLVYKAYVVNHPCEHKLKKLDETSRFKLTDQVLDRLRNAIKFPTVSYDVTTQNETALFDYVNFVRRGT
jgi:hypothetical protein